MKNYYTEDQIHQYLLTNSDQIHWIKFLRKRVSDEDFFILRKISKLSQSSYKRANDPNRQWDWNLWPEVLYNIWKKQNGRCAVTGFPLDTKQGDRQIKNPWAASIDRLDSQQGYVVGNVRLVVHWYNNAKNTWDDDVCFQAMNTWVKFVNEAKNQKTGQFSRVHS